MAGISAFPSTRSSQFALLNRKLSTVIVRTKTKLRRRNGEPQIRMILATFTDVVFLVLKPRHCCKSRSTPITFTKNCRRSRIMKVRTLFLDSLTLERPWIGCGLCGSMNTNPTVSRFRDKLQASSSTATTEIQKYQRLAVLPLQSKQHWSMVPL